MRNIEVNFDEENNRFVARCPALGLYGSGRSYRQAIKNLVNLTDWACNLSNDRTEISCGQEGR